MERNKSGILVSGNYRNIYEGEKRISPFDSYESLAWRRKQQLKAGNPDQSGENEIRLVRESSGNGSGNPLLVTTETSIRNEMNP